MNRLFSAALLGLVAATPLSAQVTCDGVAELTDRAVILRQGGAHNDRQAMKTLMDDYDQGSQMRDLVPQIVGWVWQTPADQLGPNWGQVLVTQLTAAYPGACKN